MEILIRNASINDGKAISALVRQLGYAGEADVIANRLSHMLQHPDHTVYLASRENQVIGWVHVFKTLRLESGLSTEIGGLVVDAQHRNQGIGTMLVRSAIRWSIEQNITRIRVRCNSTRMEAHRFYRQLEFREIKTQLVLDYRIDSQESRLNQ